MRTRSKKLVTGWVKTERDPRLADDEHYNSTYHQVDLEFVRRNQRKAIQGDYIQVQFVRGDWRATNTQFVFTVFGWRNGKYLASKHNGEWDGTNWINQKYIDKVIAGTTSHKPTNPYKQIRKE